MTVKTRLDKLICGLLSGFFLPFIVGIVVFLFSPVDATFSQYLEQLFLADIMTHLVSLCVLPNLLIFFVFLNFDMLKAARGVLGMTIVWAAIVFIIKLL